MGEASWPCAGCGPANAGRTGSVGACLAAILLCVPLASAAGCAGGVLCSEEVNVTKDAESLLTAQHEAFRRLERTIAEQQEQLLLQKYKLQSIEEIVHKVLAHTEALEVRSMRAVVRDASGGSWVTDLRNLVLMCGILYLLYVHWDRVRTFTIIAAVSLWAAYRKQQDQAQLATGTARESVRLDLSQNIATQLPPEAIEEVNASMSNGDPASNPSDNRDEPGSKQKKKGIGGFFKKKQ
mmetsp:Transcript_13502/g.49119  ORF Transcript_13502/g.49119 Transcript_13502/m.49119 type:complete len:238 (-) Transcript_13502:238-951(-)